MDKWLLERLACPVDREPVVQEGAELICGQGHRYPVVDGIPVMLRDDVAHTLWVAEASLTKARSLAGAPVAEGDVHAETLGISPEQRERLKELPEGGVDPVVQMSVAHTCGNLYLPVVGGLSDYPIPELRLPEACGETLLDIGCNWGRWSIAAARKGYHVVGMDPSLGAVTAAQRVSRQLGLSASFVVADGRYLPFLGGLFDMVFSYGVLQHIEKADAKRTLEESRRVMKPGGTALFQMPNLYGMRSFYNYARRGFRDPEGFGQIRYWTLPELHEAFESRIGPTTSSVDAYFGLGIQGSDLPLLPLRSRMVVRASEALRRVSRVIPALKYAADSVYLESTATGTPERAEASIAKVARETHTSSSTVKGEA